MQYVKAEFHVYPGKMTAYCDLMKELVPVMASLGWQLVAGFVNDSGRQRDVINIWQTSDANAFTSFRAGLVKVPGAEEIVDRIRECFDAEVMTLVTPAPYAPQPFK